MEDGSASVALEGEGVREWCVFVSVPVRCMSVYECL